MVKFVSTTPVLNPSTPYLGQEPASLLVAKSGADFQRNLNHLANRGARAYSITKAIKESLPDGGKLSGLEREVHEELGELMPRRNNNLRIPSSVFGQRDLDTTVGAALTETRLRPPVIPFLRNASVVGRLGATLIENVTGANLSIPRAIGSGNADWVTETGSINNAEMTFDQFMVTPRRICGYSVLSKQLAAQSVVDVDRLIANDLASAIGLATDKAALFGSGPPQPTGIMSLGANPVGQYNYSLRSPDQTFGGSLTRDALLAFELQLENSKNFNDDNTYGWVTSPKSRDVLAKTPILTGYPAYFWEQERGQPNGTVNGYPAVSSAQIGNDIVIFGKWSEVLVFSWAGLEVLVNPVTRAREGLIELFVTAFVDINFKHASAFCASTDAP